MNFLGFNFSRKDAAGDNLDTMLRRLETALETASGVAVTPENCTESPTVQAIVNSVSMHIAALPLHVYRPKGRGKVAIPDHPVARLLRNPNEWQTATSFMLDAASVLIRYGRFFAVKTRGSTGPIRALLPVLPSAVELMQDPGSMALSARVTRTGGSQITYPLRSLLYARGRARDFVTGDSPVMEAREAIALEIAAQRFGSAFFGNGAMPGIVFGYEATFRGHVDDKSRESFVTQFQDAYGRKGRFRAMLLPKGMEQRGTIPVENDKAQFLETRRLQRNIIAGAFGVPPHLVGDLERGTFSNVEQQSRDFVQKVVLPYCRIFESAMERDLLTPEDREAGITIRFNLDGTLRGSFKEQADAFKIMREMGALSANEWREFVNMNPVPATSGGDTYWQQGPSGQTSAPTAPGGDDDSRKPTEAQPSTDDGANNDDDDA